MPISYSPIGSGKKTFTGNTIKEAQQKAADAGYGRKSSSSQQQTVYSGYAQETRPLYTQAPPNDAPKVLQATMELRPEYKDDATATTINKAKFTSEGVTKTPEYKEFVTPSPTIITKTDSQGQIVGIEDTATQMSVGAGKGKAFQQKSIQTVEDQRAEQVKKNVALSTLALSTQAKQEDLQKEYLTDKGQFKGNTMANVLGGFTLGLSTTMIDKRKKQFEQKAESILDKYHEGKVEIQTGERYDTVSKTLQDTFKRQSTFSITTGTAYDLNFNKIKTKDRVLSPDLLTVDKVQFYDKKKIENLDSTSKITWQNVASKRKALDESGFYYIKNRPLEVTEGREELQLQQLTEVGQKAETQISTFHLAEISKAAVSLVGAAGLGKGLGTGAAKIGDYIVKKGLAEKAIVKVGGKVLKIGGKVFQIGYYGGGVAQGVGIFKAVKQGDTEQALGKSMKLGTYAIGGYYAAKGFKTGYRQEQVKISQKDMNIWEKSLVDKKKTFKLGKVVEEGQQTLSGKQAKLVQPKKLTYRFGDKKATVIGKQTPPIKSELGLEKNSLKFKDARDLRLVGKEKFVIDVSKTSYQKRLGTDKIIAISKETGKVYDVKISSDKVVGVYEPKAKGFIEFTSDKYALRTIRLEGGVPVDTNIKSLPPTSKELKFTRGDYSLNIKQTYVKPNQKSITNYIQDVSMKNIVPKVDKIKPSTGKLTVFPNVKSDVPKDIFRKGDVFAGDIVVRTTTNIPMAKQQATDVLKGGLKYDKPSYTSAGIPDISSPPKLDTGINFKNVYSVPFFDTKEKTGTGTIMQPKTNFKGEQGFEVISLGKSELDMGKGTRPRVFEEIKYSIDINTGTGTSSRSRSKEKVGLFIEQTPDVKVKQLSKLDNKQVPIITPISIVTGGGDIPPSDPPPPDFFGGGFTMITPRFGEGVKRPKQLKRPPKTRYQPSLLGIERQAPIGRTSNLTGFEVRGVPKPKKTKKVKKIGTYGGLDIKVKDDGKSIKFNVKKQKKQPKFKIKKGKITNFFQNAAKVKM